MPFTFVEPDPHDLETRPSESETEDSETEDSETEDSETEDTARVGRTGRVWLTGVVVTLLAVASAAVWIRMAVRAAGTGFDITDEGFYLLSYRWWDVNHRAFTGVQYIYGPIFEALDYDIAAFRLFRLGTVVATHLVFGWSFMRWLRVRRPAAPPSWSWETAGIAAIVAAGGIVYSWLPITPGYNDVVLLGALLAMSVVLRAATHVDQGKKVPVWLPVLLGLVVVTVVLAKWSSAAMLGLVLLTGLLVLAPGGFRRLLTATLLTVVGAGAGMACVHYLIVPLDVAVPQLRAVNGLIASTSYSPGHMLEMYWETGAHLLETTVTEHWPLLAAAVVVMVSHRIWVQIVAGTVGAAGLAVSVWRAVENDRLDGGAENKTIFPAALLAVGLFILVMILVSVLMDVLRRSGEPPLRSSLTTQNARSWVILGTLLLLPVAQAFGTNNALYTIAVNGFAAWLAVLIAVLTGLDRAPFVARALTAGVAAASIVATTSLGVGGVWWNPYRGIAPAVSTASMSEIPALDSLTLEPHLAAKYIVVYNHLQPYIGPEGRAVIGFDKISGIVLMLGGQPVGEAWTTGKEPGRLAAGIVSACPRGNPPWGSRLPLLVLTRQLTANDRSALAWCKLDLEADYRLLAPPAETAELMLYVPTKDLVEARP